jgi:hypothetical protein
VSYQGLTTPGTYTFRARAIDAAGNLDQSEATFIWTIDTNLPDTRIDSGPSGATSSTSATFNFSSNKPAATFECQLDAAAWQVCQSPMTLTGLAEGQHSFNIRAKDAAGTDPVPETRTWKVDLTSPETTIHSGPSGATTSTSGTLTFTASEAGSSFQCRLDGGEWSQCSSPKVYADLSLGAHTFEVRAIDAAANVDASPARRTWSISAPPVVPVTASGPLLLSPFPVVRIAGKFTSRGVLLRLFQISVREGMKVVIRCTPRKRCPFGRQARTATVELRAHAAKFLRIRKLEGHLLRAGIRLEVFITKPGMIGKYTRFKIRKSRPPKRTDRCLPPNSSKPMTCPS